MVQEIFFPLPSLECHPAIMDDTGLSATHRRSIPPSSQYAVYESAIVGSSSRIIIPEKTSPRASCSPFSFSVA